VTGHTVAGATRADHAYAELKRRLLAGDFPLNVRLGEERLAALTGVSRTPVREALLRLHAEGLVNRWSDGGFRPVAPDVGMMRHIYETRSLLEGAALRLPALHGTTHDRVLLEQLREEWEDLRADEPYEPDPGFVTLDESFHVTLAEAAGNPVLADVLRQMNDRIRLVRMQDFLVEGRIEVTIDEHLAIVQALLDGAPGRAEQLFGSHIGTSIAVVEDRVAQAVTRMALGAEDP
jgi:DNA-binding GntR family transcriptional regulator